jgi:Zn-dependent protease
VTSSIELGRIAGIRIGINWSWLVVFALITWTLASAVFPSQNPGLSKGTYIAMAIVACLLFFGSLLAHELGHALQARRDGMEIEGITLWLFGGVAKFRGMFPSGGAEFRIAIAGPLVSLVLGGLFSLLAWQVSLPEEVDGVVAWLGYINLTLLVFNLLPALPLDGGRILRAALWHFQGDFRRATLIASGIGRGFGFLFIAAGLFLFIFESSFSGAWLAFMGLFLLQAAAGEARYLATREALSGLRVRDLMVTDPVTVPPQMTLGDFMDTVAARHRFTAYPVVDDGGAVLGLLPISCAAQVPRNEWDERRVRDCMVPLQDVVVLQDDQDLADALGDMSSAGVRRGLVLDDGRLAGSLSASDALRALEIESLRRRGRIGGGGAGGRAGRAA